MKQIKNLPAHRHGQILGNQILTIYKPDPDKTSLVYMIEKKTYWNLTYLKRVYVKTNLHLIMCSKRREANKQSIVLQTISVKVSTQRIPYCPFEYKYVNKNGCFKILISKNLDLQNLQILFCSLESRNPFKSQISGEHNVHFSFP